jgi:hypothetical protein
MLSDIKYRYAADENGTVVEIESDRVIRSRDYTCLSCNNILRPVLGEVNQKHYRHMVHVACSYETYLHNLAKRIFFQTYTDCLTSGRPYNFEYKIARHCTYCKHGPCHVGTTSKETDLTRYFKEIFIEMRDGEFIPDILLRNGKESLYVEIAVTHYLEELKENSGVRIIEITINVEQDVDVVRSVVLSEHDRRVCTYNFRSKPVTGNFKNECKKTMDCFILFGSGKSIVNSIPAWKYENLCSEGTYVELVNSLGPEAYIDKVAELFKLGKNIKNCWLCVFHCLHYRSYESYCKVLKNQIQNSNQAVECAKYKSKETVPECGLMQNAVNQTKQPIRKSAQKPVLPILTTEDYRSEPVDAVFYGISMECKGCHLPLHLINYVNFERDSVILKTLHIMGETSVYYLRSALSRVLAVTHDGTPTKRIGTLVKTNGRLAVQCSACSEANFPCGKELDVKSIFQGSINSSDYLTLRLEM